MPTGIYKRTLEHNKINSISHAGRKLSPEHVAKIKAVNIGKKRSLETCKNISVSKKGKKLSLKNTEKLKFARNKPEYKAKRRAANMGEKNPMWKGGISFDPYPINFTERLKERIRERDGRICQLCGKTEHENGRKLDIHHIDYNKDNLEEHNLISLCKSCHVKTNGNRDYWQKIFN